MAQLLGPCLRSRGAQTSTCRHKCWHKSVVGCWHRTPVCISRSCRGQ